MLALLREIKCNAARVVCDHKNIFSHDDQNVFTLTFISIVQKLLFLAAVSRGKFFIC